MGIPPEEKIVVLISGLLPTGIPLNHLMRMARSNEKIERGTPVPMDKPRPQARNSLCECGSGKKFKRCCLREKK